ncbi:MAG: hypothetical protein KTR33_13920 [Gammaproteobacteria bacterium]|nr:hypothetical protein [Gammaproteobacteria bacterium]
MPVPSLTQTSSDGGSGDTVTLTGVTAGATLVALLTQHSSTDRTYSISDDQSNVWADSGTLISSNGRRVQAAYALDVAGGTTVIDVNPSASNQLTSWYVYEWANLGELDLTFDSEDHPSESTHDLFNPAANLSTNSVAFFAIAVNSVTTLAASGYTTETVGNVRCLLGYQIFASGAAAEACNVTDSNSRNGMGVAFALRDVAASGGAPISLPLTGVG